MSRLARSEVNRVNCGLTEIPDPVKLEREWIDRRNGESSPKQLDSGREMVISHEREEERDMRCPSKPSLLVSLIQTFWDVLGFYSYLVVDETKGSNTFGNVRRREQDERITVRRK